MNDEVNNNFCSLQDKSKFIESKEQMRPFIINLTQNMRFEISSQVDPNEDKKDVYLTSELYQKGLNNK